MISLFLYDYNYIIFVTSTYIIKKFNIKLYEDFIKRKSNKEGKSSLSRFRTEAY